MPRRPPDILRKSHAHTEGKLRSADKRALERELDESLGTGERTLLLSLDGCVCRDDRLIPGALETIAWLDQQGIEYLLVAEDGSPPHSALRTKLANLGIDVRDDQILTVQAARARIMEAGDVPVATLAELPSKLGDR